MLKRIAIVFGAVFILIGILGFIPAVAPLAPNGEYHRLFGVFAVDTMHNVVHLLTGIVAIACGMASEAASRNYFRIFGILYGLIAIMGFMSGHSPQVMGMAHNVADAVLHTAIAIVALVIGFTHLPDRLAHHDTGHHPA